MTDDEQKPGNGKAGEGSDDATRMRKTPASDGDDATELRGSSDLDKTELLPDAGPEDTSDDGQVDIFVASAGADDDEEEDATELRGKPRAPQEVDDDEATQFRGGADKDEDEDDATELRGAAVEDDDDGEATQFRRDSPESEEDSTQINSKTQSMPAVGRASLGPAKDAPRLQKRPPGPDDDDATYMRGAGATESDATRMRPGNLPADDDATVAGADFGDDEDITMQAGGRPLADDDATVQGAGRAPRDTDIIGAGDDDPTVQGSSGSAAARPAVPAPTKTVGPGVVLKGRFTLTDKLGAGGMGGVFKAVDLVKQEARDRNPYVAVKVLNEAFAEHEDSFLALQRESSRSQRLTHPNIAAVYDFDKDGDVAYMVMELLEGSPLDSYLKKNKQGLEPEAARNVIRDVSAALAYAHTQTPALVHSDFKPGNIFYTADGVAKVFDFGIARAATASSDDVIKNTGPVDIDAMEDDGGEDGTLFDAGKLGALTPAYAAVEMFEGRDPAPQDDVYALGIVAYQCLTGKHPFNRQKAPVAAAQGMVPERPDGLTTREWRAIKRALEFKREDRTPDAQAFLDEFFFTGTKTVLAVAATAAIMAIGVATLYFAGVIGPQAPTADPNPDWVALESEINVPRTAALNELANANFTTNDDFVAWEGALRQNLQAWDQRDAPTIVLQSVFDSEQEALDEQKRIFEATGLSLAVDEPAGAAGDWRLTAGPFRYLTAAEADAGDASSDRRLALEEFEAELAANTIPYDVERDDAAIAAARDRALDVYLAEFRRRLPAEQPPRLDVVVRALDQYYDVPPVWDEGTRTYELLEKQGGIWTADPDAQATVNAVIARIRGAGADGSEEDRLRGPSVLARAERDYPVRPADIAAARTRADQLIQAWNQSLLDAQSLAGRYMSQFRASQSTLVADQARKTERENVAKARVDGNEGTPIEITYTIDNFDEVVGVRSRVIDEYRNDSNELIYALEFPGVYSVFSRQCNQPGRVGEALEDFPYLTGPQRDQALRYLRDCMVSKVVNNTDGVLASKDLLLAEVDYAPIAAIESPDPCSAVGYVGAGRNAFCRDTFTGGAAPPVVIIDGAGADPNFGIGKYEVSIAEYNTFAGATGRAPLAGPGRLPATGVSLDDARAYTAWLSGRTDRTYRLPTVAEWRHAASANGDTPDPNRNCYSNVRGVIRGETLVNVGQGAPNAWGLVNHVGNAEEWAVADAGVIALGGKHTDELAACGVTSARTDAQAPDVARGFRVLREIDRPAAMLASAGGS